MALLESALDRPRNRLLHETHSDLSSLAASYGFGIARNHPFVDGNKRVAFLAMYVFLAMNGEQLEVADGEVIALMLALAAGDISESELVGWLRDKLG